MSVYKCPMCGRRSAHPEDAKQLFCVVCGFQGDKPMTWIDRYRFAADRCGALIEGEPNDLVRQALMDAQLMFRKAENEHADIEEKERRKHVRYTLFQEADLASAEKGYKFDQARRECVVRGNHWKMLPDAEFEALLIYTMVEKGEDA